MLVEFRAPRTVDCPSESAIYVDAAAVRVVRPLPDWSSESNDRVVMEALAVVDAYPEKHQSLSLLAVGDGCMSIVVVGTVQDIVQRLLTATEAGTNDAG